MKLKLKGTAKCTITIDIPPSNKEGIAVAIRVKKKHQEGPAPDSLLQRINGCEALPELMELLFSTTEKTEAILKAFDDKIDALERKGQTLPIHPLKKNNNGSITPTTAA